MKIERIEGRTQNMLCPTITVTFECIDQQEYDTQIKVMEHIRDTRLLAVVGGYREE